MDISALRDRPTSGPMSVSELNGYIKNIFDTNRLLSSVSVAGEISNFVSHRTGHLYFSLKDGEGQIRAVMFRSAASSLRFMPENGMRVIVRGSVSVYVRDGTYQIYVSSMQPDGVGALYVAYEQMKVKLASEGLFDEEYKKPIPEFPSRIGVITSPTGAAVRDIINVLGRRYPLASVYVYPALVQGDGAEDSLIAGLDYFDKSGLVDTVIIGRGGGSIEDLWAFNGERLARRIFDMHLPVISAVGHETDFTICDFVSDLRAPTPSAAAELASPDIRELILRVDVATDRCDRALMRLCEHARERFNRLTSAGVIADPLAYIREKTEQLCSLRDECRRAYESLLVGRRGELSLLAGKLESLNPLSVIARGYSLVEQGGRTVKKVSELSVGDNVTIRLVDGEAVSEVTEIRRK